MTRFIHLDRPLAYPFFDIVTRDTNAGACFDLSVLLEDYTGSIYVRDAHIIEMARSIGMATADEVADLRSEIAELKARIDRLPAAQEELKNGLANLVSKFHTDLLADSPELPVGNTESESTDSESETAERETIGSVSL